MKKILIFSSLTLILLLSACSNSSKTETITTNGIVQCGTEVIQPSPIQKAVVLTSESSDIVEETDENYDPNSFRISEMRSCFYENLEACNAAQFKHVEFQTNADGIREKLVTRALINGSCKVILQSHTELPDSIKDSKKTFCYKSKLEGKKNNQTLTIFDCDDETETTI